jgi:hypothetical protein
MRKLLILILFLFINNSIHAEASKESEANAYKLLKGLGDWDKKIDLFSINYSLTYKSSQMKIKKVERRSFSFIKKKREFSHFRHDLLHPEKIAFIVTPQKFLKYNFLSKKIEEEISFNTEATDDTSFDLKKTNGKARELLKNVNLIGATLPDEFQSYTVFRRAIVENEIIYKNRLCYLITAKSSDKAGKFWISKDRNNLLKYVIVSEDKLIEEVEIVKMKKLFDDIFIPIEVVKRNRDEDGKIEDIIHIKYYGFAVNRNLPPKTFEL